MLINVYFQLMTIVMRVIGQRERNRDRGEIRIAKIVITRGGNERKSEKCIIRLKD